MWRTIDSAPKNEPILIRYLKKGKSSRTHVCDEWIVTQAIAKPLFLHVHSNPMNRNHDSFYSVMNNGYNFDWTATPTDFVEWVDGLDRLIVNTSSKKIVNQVTHWMPIPTLEEEWTELTLDKETWPEHGSWCWIKLFDGELSKMPRRANVFDGFFESELAQYEWSSVSHWKPAHMIKVKLDEHMIV